MKKLLLLLILSFFSAQGYAGSCPDGSEPVRSISADGTYFVYNCDNTNNEQASSSSVAESTWNSNFKFNGQKWDATSTNHIKESIIIDREFKRDAASKESIHFILETQKCIPHSTSGDCERGVRRSQLRNHKNYKRNKDLIFNFSIYQKESNTPGHSGNHQSAEINKSKGGGSWMNIFEIKPKFNGKIPTNPSLVIYLDPNHKKLHIIMTVCPPPFEDPSCHTLNKFDAGILKTDTWHDFIIETRQSLTTDGYVRIFQNKNLIFEKSDLKTVYKYKGGLRYWIGPYIWSGAHIAQDEPNHEFWYDNINVLIKY